jgi:predicted nuclease with TOPRIM domain
MSGDVYEANAPCKFPEPKEQAEVELETAQGEVMTNPPIKETVDRWRKEIIDKIQYLRESLESANQDKEALTHELDRVQSELSTSKERTKVLEGELSEVLETFNALLNEVSRALEK